MDLAPRQRMGLDGSLTSRRRAVDAYMRIVREGLEGLMEPGLATATVLDAMGELERWADLADPVGVEDFVKGPLRLAVRARLGSVAAADVTDRVCQMLAMVRAQTAPDTREVPFAEGPVRVLLLGTSARLGVTLRAQIGGSRLALGHASDLPQARTMLSRLEPEMLVIDASDPPDGNVADLLLLLTEVPQEATIVLFGSEQPWGARVLSMRFRNQAQLLPLERTAGLDPLVDMVLSRRAA